MKKLTLLIILFANIAIAEQHTVTLDQNPAPLRDWSYSIGDEAVDINIGSVGIHAEFPFVGWTDYGDYPTLSFLEALRPSSVSAIIDSSSATWYGIYDHAIAQYRYSDWQISKSLIFDQPLSTDIIVSPTDSEYFPSASDPRFAIVYTNFSMNLGDNQIVADGVVVSDTSQLIVGSSILIRDVTGAEIFRFQPGMADAGESFGTIVISFTDKKLVYLFDDFWGRTEFDPTIITQSSSYVFINMVASNNASTVFQDYLHIEVTSNTRQGGLRFDPSYFTDLGYSLSTVTISDVTIQHGISASGGGSGCVISLSTPTTAWGNDVTWNGKPSYGVERDHYTPSQVNDSSDTIHSATVSTIFQLWVSDAVNSGTQWQCGLWYYYTGASGANDWTYYNGGDRTRGPKITITFTAEDDPGSGVDWDSVAVGTDSLILSSSNANHTNDNVLSGVLNKYYLCNVLTGNTIMAGTIAVASFSVGSVTFLSTYLIFPESASGPMRLIADCGSGHALVEDLDIYSTDVTVDNDAIIMGVAPFVASVSDEVLNNRPFIASVSDQVLIAQSQIVGISQYNLLTHGMIGSISTDMTSNTAWIISNVTVSPFVAASVLATATRTKDDASTTRNAADLAFTAGDRPFFLTIDKNSSGTEESTIWAADYFNSQAAPDAIFKTTFTDLDAAVNAVGIATMVTYITGGLQ